MPKWCWDWLGSDGQACAYSSDGCDPVGRLCTPAEIAAQEGCAAGTVPASDKKGDCAAAGSFAGSAVPRDWHGDMASLPPVPPLADAIPPGVPPLTALPAADDTFFCSDEKTGEQNFCTDAELEVCHRASNGELPDKLKCLHVGVPWPSVCPPGFLVDELAVVPKGQLPPCLPDPKDCGTDPWPMLSDPASAVYVSADTGDDAGTGSKDKPLKTIGKAMKIAGESKDIKDIAVAAGVYKESLKIDKNVAITGRCAAMVRIVGDAGQPVASVTGPNPKHVFIRQLHLTGNGTGIAVTGAPSQVKLHNTLIDKVAVAAIRVEGPSTLLLSGGVISGISPSNAGYFGRGIEALQGAQVTLADVRISKSHELGVFVNDIGTQLFAQSLLIDGTLAQAADLQAGRGIGVQNGAHAALSDVRLSGNHETGLFVSDKGTTIDVNGLLVDGTLSADIDKQYGIGLMVYEGAQATLQAVRLTGNREIGLLVSGAGSKVSGLHVLIDGTQARLSDKKFGRGIDVLKGGRLTLLDARISGNRDVGISLNGTFSKLTATRLLIDGTLAQQSDKQTGRGLSVQFGVDAVLQNVRLSGNRELGLLVAGFSSFVASDLLVDGTLAQESDGQFGWGMGALGGARVTLRDTRLSANREVGLALDGQDVVLHGTRLIVDGTLPLQADQHGGRGMSVQLGAHVVLRNARLSNNREMGLFVAGADATLDASGLLVDGTLSQASDGHFGRGIGVQDGANLRLAGARVVANRESGMSVMFSAVVALVGVTVDATAPADIDQSGGSGVWMLGKSTATILASAFRNNRGVALAAAGSRVAAHGSLLSSTNSGDYAEVDILGGYTGKTTKLADGILLNAAADSVIDHCLVVGNARAGILVESSSGVKVTNTLIDAAKGTYGLDLQHSVGAIDVFNAIFGASAQDRAADAGLSLPRAPEAAAALPGK